MTYTDIGKFVSVAKQTEYKAVKPETPMQAQASEGGRASETD